MRAQDDGWAIDERESHILGLAARRALNFNFGFGIAAAVVLMMLGWVVFALLAVIWAVIPHQLFTAAAKKSGVDVYALAGRQKRLHWWKVAVVASIIVVLLAATAGYAAQTGNPLIPGPLSAEITDQMASFLTGFAGGGIVGGVLGLVAAAVAGKRAVRRESSDVS